MDFSDLRDDFPFLGDDSKTPIQYLIDASPGQRLLLLVLAIPLIFGGVWFLVRWFFSPPDYSTQVSLYSAIISGFLTFGIIWVYLELISETSAQTELASEARDLQSDLASIQEDQTAIQKTQMELMEAEYIPDLTATNLRVGAAHFRDARVEIDCDRHDILRLSISNHSNITAKDLHLKTIVDYKRPSDWPFQLISGFSVPLNRTNSERWSPGEGSLITAEEIDVDVQACAKMGMDYDMHTKPISVNDGVNELRDAGVEKLRVGLVLVAIDKKGDWQNVDLQGWEIELNTDQPFGLQQIANGKSINTDTVRNQYLEKHPPFPEPPWENQDE